MSTPNQPPFPDQDRVVKGKSPRNALYAVGGVFAVIIGAMGYYYQSKAGDEADQQARAEKAEKAAAAVDHKPDNDIDRIIADQQAKARRDEQAAREAAASAPAPASKPGISLDQYERDSHATNALASDAKDDSAAASPIFIAGGRMRGQAQQAAPAANGVLTPQQMAMQQASAQAAAAGTAEAQAKAIAATMGQGNSAGPSSGERDAQFLNAAKAQSASGEGSLSAGFVGQAGSCTLSPPHHIGVLVTEGENSDRPGTASLMVEQDVYDSVTGTCLMIPKGTMITAPYQSDIKVGQESILVASTMMTLPNGKHVALYGAEGADQNGYAGFSGDVNNHFWKIFGASFLTAILLNHFDGSDTTSTTSSPYGVTQVGSTAGQVAAQTSQSILSRYQNIPPTITIKPGKRFMIKVNRDIHLGPYRG
ncbi:Conjugal transfer protein TraI [Paraburkholderia unamae]|uniref:TrbI/VirB10 family protein n=1 Tax=Paraburkholderia unamae TaxID=219649 RepID=UPI001CB38D30|nr:TrbI/VirB10 family protein [Paraburkholderia unamae]CAG9255284.1 Conjugal transfer protein TraI [Paraburkholderia unamae]